MSSAREIGDFFRKQALKDSDLMVLIGDFNAEPGERVMANQRTVGTNQFVAARERAVVRRDRNRLAYFYNPMWRLMGEPDAWDGSPPDDPSDAPLGTYCADWTTRIGWSVFDQLMVSKRALTSPLLALRETTVRVQPPVSGCSDHCAVAAQFRY